MFKRYYINILLLFLIAALFAVSCEKQDNDTVPESRTSIQKKLGVGVMERAFERNPELKVVIAANYDPDNADYKIVYYVGGPAKDKFSLPKGDWMVVFSDSEGNAYITDYYIESEEEIISVPETIPQNPEEIRKLQKEYIYSCLNYLLAVKQSVPMIQSILKTAEEDTTGEKLDGLYDIYDELHQIAGKGVEDWRKLYKLLRPGQVKAFNSETPLKLLNTFTTEAFASSTSGWSPEDVFAAVCFFKTLGAVKDNARKRMIFIFENALTEQQREEGFRVIMDTYGSTFSELSGLKKS